VNKAIGEVWQQLSQDEKADYEKLAEKDKVGAGADSHPTV
jgi:hypothetical protein